MKPEKPVAIVLGGTTPHIALIENLQSRGYYVLLIDYLEAPAAHDAADEHIQASALDADTVLHIARERKAALVISICLDITIPIVAYVSDQLNLPSIYTPQNAKLFTDKLLMKQRMVASGIPTPEILSLPENAKHDYASVDFPIVIKPVDSTGSLGLSVVEQPEDVDSAIALARQHGTTGQAFAEKWIKGSEYGVDCIVIEHEAHVLLIRERLKYQDKYLGRLHCYATITRDPGLQPELEAISKTIAKIPKAFSINNVPMHIQGILNRVGQFEVIEIAFRISGGASGFRNINLKTGFDLPNAVVGCNLGQTPILQIDDNGLIYTSINLYARQGRLASILGVKDLLRSGAVLEFYPYRRAGHEFGAETTARNRVAACIICAPTHKELCDKIKMLYDRIRILDDKGINLLDDRLMFDIERVRRLRP